uniref:Uncharacterized protein n=1 Tax=Alexandrium monilatum TaxID=311494 RepID=A0A7S4V160_9DINO
MPAGLPEDAPKGHIAHSACKYGGIPSAPIVRFRIKTANGLLPFQTTLAAAGWSRVAAEVIARSCYMKFEAGWSKDQVLKYRTECYARLQCGKQAGRPLQAPTPPPLRPAEPSAGVASAQPETGRPLQQAPAAPPRTAGAPAPVVSSHAAPPRTTTATAASVCSPATAVPTATARRGSSGGGGCGGSRGQGQTPSGQGVTPAKRSAPIVVRSAPFAAPAPLHGPAPTGQVPAGWVSSGYLRCFLDDPSKAPPAPANEPWEEARSRSPVMRSSASQPQAGTDKPTAAVGLRMGGAPCVTSHQPGAVRPPGGLVHRSRPMSAAAGLSDSPTPPVPQAGLADFNSELPRSSGVVPQRHAPSNGGPVLLPPPRPDNAAEEEEECSQPTPQLAQHTPLHLGTRATSALFDPTPQLDEPTPCLSLPTPCFTPMKPQLLPPPRPPPRRPEPPKPARYLPDSPERPTPCLCFEAVLP